MAITITFKPFKTDFKIGDVRIDKVMAPLFYNKYFLGHSQAFTVKCEKNGALRTIEVTIASIYAANQQSTAFIVSKLRDILHDIGLSENLYLSSIANTQTITATTCFDAKYFRPQKTKNQETLDLLGVKEGEIPDAWVCPLSGDVMDKPIYLVQAPGTKYELEQFKYAVDISDNQIMPGTALPYDEKMIQIDYSLMTEIVQFISKKNEEKTQRDLDAILTDLKITAEEIKENKGNALNKALRRAAHNGNSETIYFLIAQGAKINAQDNNPILKMTPLHYAITQNHLEAAWKLIKAGAMINIKDAKGKTALDLLNDLPNSSLKTNLLEGCANIHPDAVSRDKSNSNNNPNI